MLLRGKGIPSPSSCASLLPNLHRSSILPSSLLLHLSSTSKCLAVFSVFFRGLSSEAPSLPYQHAPSTLYRPQPVTAILTALYLTLSFPNSPMPCSFGAARYVSASVPPPFRANMINVKCKCPLVRRRKVRVENLMTGAWTAAAMMLGLPFGSTHIRC